MDIFFLRWIGGYLRSEEFNILRPVHRDHDQGIVFAIKSDDHALQVTQFHFSIPIFLVEKNIAIFHLVKEHSLLYSSWPSLNIVLRIRNLAEQPAVEAS